MQTSTHSSSSESALRSARLVRSERITPTASKEEVRQLVFRTEDLAFDGKVGSCIRIMAPGQFGNQYHSRLYSIADQDHSPKNNTEFSICVRRCSYVRRFQRRGIRRRRIELPLRPAAR